jgi:hypothetical protein
MGLFAKGKYGKLEYRLSYNKPFATNLVPTNAQQQTMQQLTTAETQMVKSWLSEYQFLDQKLMYSLIKWAVTLELKKCSILVLVLYGS